METSEKFAALKEYLKDLKKVAVAFSAGVDSTFLLNTAADVLKENAVAFMEVSPLISNADVSEAESFCKSKNITLVKIDDNPLEIKEFAQNPTNRCYYCKKNIFSALTVEAKKMGIENIVEGTNADDVHDYRPGIKAIKELNIKSPLKELGFSKDEIRKFSKEAGLKTYARQSMACFASRVPYGEQITEEKIKMIMKGEKLLDSLCFNRYRLRVHSGNLARIEIAQEDFSKLLEHREKIISRLKELGFLYITLDLQGFRSGSMNEVLKDEIKNA